MKDYKLSLTILFLLFISTALIAQDGEQLYKQHCTACHQVSDVKTVGPGLLNIGDKRDKEWLKEWIKDSQAFINSGNADAVQIFKEFNEMVMPPFTQLSDADIDAILVYLGVGAKGGEAVAETPVVEEVAPVNFTKEDEKQGELLFLGKQKFVNGGASCISCHTVDYDNIYGGNLAKNLTDAHERLSTAGVTGIVSNPPFPAMKETYNDNKLTDEEVHQLTAFLKLVSAENAGKAEEAKVASTFYLLPLGLVGAILLVVLVYVIWSKRKVECVKEGIYRRQIIN
ncbi:MAG: c-type cytochrome [Bacteroidetes bacterium]|nr:c-type cytochrome [Bacteroidota bacterium]MCB9226935.1 c-type cytochrome [Chitinophagales bacterium]